MDRNTPPYKFAIVPRVIEQLPAYLPDGTQLQTSSFLPKRGRDKDTGYDVRCAEPGGLEICPEEYFKMRLGFRCFSPDGWWLKLAPRSGTFINHNIHALYGVIEETYENELCFVGQYLPDGRKLQAANKCFKVHFGERIAQIIPAPRYEMPVEEIDNEEYERLSKLRNDPRGTGGFGSSGNF